MTATVVDIRRYSLVTIEGETQLAVFTQGKWTIDATCESINDLLSHGLLSEDSIQGWIEKRVLRKTKYGS
jgi:hypothetical protein